MREPEATSKQRLIQAATGLLKEVDDVDTVTARQIADRAGVGLGLINYHFQSKENLLHAAVAGIIDGITAQQKPTPMEKDPVQRLIQAIIGVSDFALKHRKFHKLVVMHELQHGTFHAPMRYIPILREIFPTSSEMDLRLMALQFVTPLQVILLNPEAFRLYAGIDAFDKAQRDQTIERLVDHLVHHRAQAEA